MKTILLILLFLTGFIFGAVIQDAYLWHQIERQAQAADLAEGDQL